jgi:RimJ/RimL family protein N-acetyltransferase
MTCDSATENARDAAHGASSDPAQPRSQGPLGAAELQRLLRSGTPVAFDPAQGGWVHADAEDDLYLPPAMPQAGTITHGRSAQPVREFGGMAGLPLGDHRLRPWRASEAARLAELLGDAEVWRHLPESFSGALTEEDAAALIALANGGAHHEVLAVEHDGEIIGQVRLEFAADGREAELSYWFGRAHWGKGHAGRVVPAFVAETRARHAPLDRLTARVHRDNAASARVLARAGFTEEATRGDWRHFSRGMG